MLSKIGTRRDATLVGMCREVCSVCNRGAGSHTLASIASLDILWRPPRNEPEWFCGRYMISRVDSTVLARPTQATSHHPDIFSEAGGSVVGVPRSPFRGKHRGESILLHGVGDRLGLVERSCVGIMHLNVSGVDGPRSNHAHSRKHSRKHSRILQYTLIHSGIFDLLVERHSSTVYRRVFFFVFTPRTTATVPTANGQNSCSGR
jgi:hypothetical protein